MLRTTLLLSCLICGGLLTAQDTVYTPKKNYYDVRITDNQPTYIQFDEWLDEFTRKTILLQKTEVTAIATKGGLREIISHAPQGISKPIYYVIENGDTFPHDPDYNPTEDYKIDSSVKLCRFKKDDAYVKLYGSRPHFYINDPDKKFFNCKEVTYAGVIFGYMKLINEREIPKAATMKNRHLEEVCTLINHYDNMRNYRKTFFSGKETLDEMYLSDKTYKRLQPMSWITDTEYQIEPGKIPAIIHEIKFTKKEGIGAVFIIEKLSKPLHTVSGYWVIFDFSTGKTLLMDYISYNKVAVQIESFMDGWRGYWEAGIHSAGVYEPVSFQKYLELKRKDNLKR